MDIPSRAEYARLAADQLANHYDDKLDHLMDAIEALERWINNGRGRWSPGHDPRVPKRINALRKQLKDLLAERHIAVKTAYDQAWTSYDQYRWLARQIPTPKAS